MFDPIKLVKAELRRRFEYRWKRCHDGSTISIEQRQDDVTWIRAAISWVRQSQSTQEEITRLQKLAYIGEHHFPDLTYKARLEETVGDLRCTELKLEQSKAALMEVHAHLATALCQCVQEDDQIIVGHIRDALTLTKQALINLRINHTKDG